MSLICTKCGKAEAVPDAALCVNCWEDDDLWALFSDKLAEQGLVPSLPPPPPTEKPSDPSEPKKA